MGARERILDAVQARIGGAADAFIEVEYADAVEEFYERSTAFRHVATVTLRPEHTSYFLVLPRPEVHISRLLMVGTSYEQLIPVPEFIEGMTGSSHYFFAPATTLKLREAPTEEKVVSVVMVLAPESPLSVPDELLVLHREGIKDLLLSRLFAVPQRPWTSERLAQLHSRRASRAIAEARQTANQGYGNKPWAFPSFA
jgi:hypothetical protein